MPIFVSSKSDEIQSMFDWVDGGSQPAPDNYLRGMVYLEWLWRQTVPGLSFKVMHDEPERLPSTSTRTAIAVFAALKQDRIAQKWFARNIRNVVVHCTASIDAISFVGDSIHFFDVKEFPENLGARLFDRLSQRQKEDYAELNPGRDPQKEFATLVKSMVITHPDKDHLQGLGARNRTNSIARSIRTITDESRGNKGFWQRESFE